MQVRRETLELGDVLHVPYSPFVIAEFVAVIICRNDVGKEDVFSFWVHPTDLHLIAWEHPPKAN